MSSRPGSRRPASSRAVSWSSLLAGGLLGLVATSRPWWRIHSDTSSPHLTGTDSTGGLSQALMMVVLAGVLLCLVLRSRGRRVLAAILAIGGAAALALGASHPRPSTGKIEQRLREVTLSDRFDLVITAWPWLFAAAGVLILLGAITMLATAQHWPTRSDRFARSDSFSRSGDLAGERTLLANGDPALTAGEPAADPALVWKAMDAGLDPTADPPIDRTVDPASHVATDPGGQWAGSHDTMDSSGASDVNRRTAQNRSDRTRATVRREQKES